MWKLTRSIQDAPSTPEEITLEFERGLPSSLVAGGKTITGGVPIFLELNALARKHGIGRIDIVENRFIGVKSRGCYETPAGTILRKAHMDLEGLTVDRNVRALRDGFVPFGVEGEARTRWKVAGLVAVNQWTRLTCQIRFFWPNGTALPFKCSSKSKFVFF